MALKPIPHKFPIYSKINIYTSIVIVHHLINLHTISDYGQNYQQSYVSFADTSIIQVTTLATYAFGVTHY